MIYRIFHQGGPIINSGGIVAQSKDIVAIEIDMRSKRCEIGPIGWAKDCPLIWIDPTNALHLKKGSENRFTQISFPKYKWWDVFVAEIVRYTMRVVLVKRTTINPEYK